MSQPTIQQTKLAAGTTFHYHGASYRIEAFLCEMPKRVATGNFLDDMLADWEAEEDAKVPAGHERIKLRFCLPDEATFVAGSGVCGVVARITDIVVTGTVSWSEQCLAEAQAEAYRLAREVQTPTTIVRPIRSQAA